MAVSLKGGGNLNHFVCKESLAVGEFDDIEKLVRR
jgi:hypothetical protein